jgi:homogentisate 1,2-dioxygenase
MPLGLLSHAPQGIHHGAPERARQRARRLHDEHTRVEWQVINIDSRRRLVPTEAAQAYVRFDTDPEVTP